MNYLLGVVFPTFLFIKECLFSYLSNDIMTHECSKCQRAHMLFEQRRKTLKKYAMYIFWRDIDGIPTQLTKLLRMIHPVLLMTQHDQKRERKLWSILPKKDKFLSFCRHTMFTCVSSHSKSITREKVLWVVGWKMLCGMTSYPHFMAFSSQNSTMSQTLLNGGKS